MLSLKCSFEPMVQLWGGSLWTSLTRNEGVQTQGRKLRGDAVTHSTAFSGVSTLCYIYGLRWWMWARSEERGARMRWRTAVYGSGFKGHISIRETYQVLTLLDFTQRGAVESPCGLDISFPDVDTRLILCVQQNMPTVVDLSPFSLQIL